MRMGMKRGINEVAGIKKRPSSLSLRTDHRRLSDDGRQNPVDAHAYKAPAHAWTPLASSLVC